MKKIPPYEPHLSNIDSNASKEAESFANEDLEKEANKTAHYRKESFRKHLGKAALVIFWILVISFSTMAVIWVYHLITPGTLHFLTALQIDRLQTILFSATVVKIGQDYANKHF